MILPWNFGASESAFARDARPWRRALASPKTAKARP